MRRLLVVLALMLAGSAAITVAGGGPLAPHDEPTPPAAEAVLSTVRSVLSPVAPGDPAVMPAPAERDASAVVHDLVTAEQPAVAPAPEPSPAPKREEAAADDARCEPLNVTLSAGPRSVAPGEQSTLLVVVGNPGNRPLSRLSITHQLTGSDGVRFSVVSTNPPADSVSAGKVAFDNLGRVGVGGTRQVQIVLSVERTAKAGEIVSNVVATGDCERGAAGTVAVTGKGSLQEPAIAGRAAAVAAPAPAPPKAPAAAPAPAPSPAPPRTAAAAPAAGGGLLSRTGGLVGLAVACYLTAAGIGLQMLGRRRRRACALPVRWTCEERV
jgi:hypothetical protein